MTVGMILLRGAGSALAAALLLAACGGGNDTVEPFEPQRLLVFGDEASLITPAGRKYTVNALDPLNTETTDPDDRTDVAPLGSEFNCGANRIWVQTLADFYGFRFANCNPDPDVTPQRGTIYATVGARVADIAAQVGTHLAGSEFRSTDLAAVYAGQYDITDVYQTVTEARQCSYNDGNPDASGAAAIELRRRGALLAEQVKRIGGSQGRGARVLYITVPNQGATPYGRQETEDNTDFDRGACLRELTDAFNGGLRNTVTNDGRYFGVVALDEQVSLLLRFPSAFGYANVADPACTVALPDCTPDTVVEAAETTRFLWADDRLFGVDLHERLGALAVQRARDNPF